VTDSPVATRFVAAPDHWSRNGARPRAIVVHMAEGGGTVSWLTRDDGNSSHYVVEYSGAVVQMVPEELAAGSMNPRLTRSTDDPPYTFDDETVTYGATALEAARMHVDPNRYAIAIEVEGFAAHGPNAAQVEALAALIADIRRRSATELHVLGHRDQQLYKPCPGHRMPWSTIAGRHGAPLEELPDMPVKAITTTVPKLIAWPDGTPYFALDGVTQVGTAGAVVDRYSPFGCGTMRAFYRGDKALALVTPASISDVPATDTELDGRTAMRLEAIAAVEALVP
jgi:hypothetical protein